MGISPTVFVSKKKNDQKSRVMMGISLTRVQRYGLDMDTGPKRVNSMHRFLSLFFIFAEGEATGSFLDRQSSAKPHLLRIEKTKVVDEEHL
jgi:hypothetical protein